MDQDSEVEAGEFVQTAGFTQRRQEVTQTSALHIIV